MEVPSHPYISDSQTRKDIPVVGGQSKLSIPSAVAGLLRITCNDFSGQMHLEVNVSNTNGAGGQRLVGTIKDQE